PHDDLLDYLHGSFLSSSGPPSGDLRAHLETNYGDFIASNGLRQDLDGDGDLDVGSNNPDSSTNFFRAYSGQFAPQIPVDKIATLTWTYTGGGNGETTINFRAREVLNGAQWGVDGFTYDPSLAPFRSGDPVAVAVLPEANTAVHLGVLFASFSYLFARGKRFRMRGRA